MTGRLTRLLLGVLLLGSGCPHAEGAEEPSPRLREEGVVTPAQVQAWQRQGVPITWLDVRQPDEFAAGHLPGALNVGWEQVASLAATLPHDHPIILYCIHSTHRAPAAAQTLRHLGFAHAVVLDGGLVAWQAGGQTLLASDPQQAPVILPKTERCRATDPS